MGEGKGRDQFVLALSSVARVPYKESSCSGGGLYVLIEAEEVVGVIATLQRLESIVLLGPVGLADPLLTLLHEKVHIDACVVGLECRPEVSDPLPFLVEALTRRGNSGDVERVTGAASAEGRLVLANARDRPPALPDREGRQRGVDSE